LPCKGHIKKDAVYKLLDIAREEKFFKMEFHEKSL
jgi:hypothetical protein